MLNYRLTIGTVVDKRFGTLGACLAHLMRNEGEQLNICGRAFIYETVQLELTHGNYEKCIVVFDLGGLNATS